MSYFSKSKLKETIQKEIDKCINENGKFLTPPEQSNSQIDNNEDVVGFFWIKLIKNEKPSMNGKAFVRIDNNLYTDDRYALDSIQAQKENKTISEIIKERNNGNKKITKLKKSHS